jgi:Zn-finger nucleic acid-binding protein
MKCPVDNTTLVMSDKNGVEIDYCPTCRGVWLDRGELDKIVARAQAEAAPPMPLQEPARGAPVRQDSDRDRGDRRRHDDDDDDDYRRGRSGKRRDSFLSDLFDF